eukprot:superscaffoldBa00006268_g21333
MMMSGEQSALLRSARQGIIRCSDHEANCTARSTETLALSAASAWSGNGSAVDAYRLVELQLPASAAPTESVQKRYLSLLRHLGAARTSRLKGRLYIFFFTGEVTGNLQDVSADW